MGYLTNDFKKYISIKFSAQQLEQIFLGLKSEEEIDVSLYAHPEASVEFMSTARLGLIDTKGELKSYVKHDVYDANQLYWIAQGLKSKVKVTSYSTPSFNGYQMEQIYRGLLDEIDISLYNQRGFKPDQMKQIRRALYYDKYGKDNVE